VGPDDDRRRPRLRGRRRRPRLRLRRRQRRALATPGPVVIEAVVDPLEAPLPARITRDQALKFAESLVRGEPDRVAIATNAIGEKIREMI
jgi:hypothetical protein